MRRRRCNSKVIIKAKWMVFSGRLRVMQSRIINATTAFTQHPRSISRRCDLWEWLNKVYYKEPPRTIFDGGFLRTEEISVRASFSMIEFVCHLSFASCYMQLRPRFDVEDRKSTRLNSSHT